MKHRSIAFTLLFILLSCSWLAFHFSWKGNDGKAYTRIIESDGRGYYMYLPNLFIRKDLRKQAVDNRYIFQTPHGSVNKYYAGTAVAMLPFFGAGYWVARCSDAPADGYSRPFQEAISIAGLFYLCMGLFFLGRFLLLYEIRPGIICITLLLLVFGTNLLVYTVYHPSFSHIYSFAFISLFLYTAKNILGGIKHRARLALLAFSFGMIILIRPSNGIILFILPFLAGSAAELKAFLQWCFRLKNIPAGIFIFLGVISIQLCLWEIQAGQLFVWSYRHEGFYFLHPQLFRVLFSFRKGFFIYTPLALLSLCGLWLVYKKSRFRFYSIALFYLLLVYITASWWCWYYGPSFGQRAFIEFYGINALLLALLLQELRYRKAVLFAAITCAALNIVQSYQYVQGIISSWDMSTEKYRYTFLKTSSFYTNCLGGCDDIMPYSQKQTLITDTKNDFEKAYEHWNSSPLKTLDDAHHNVCDFSGKNYMPAFYLVADTALTRYRLLYAEVLLERMEAEASGKDGPIIVCSVSNAKKGFDYYYTFRLNEVPNTVAGEWRTLHYSLELPPVKATGNLLQVFIWNMHYNKFYVDNFSVRLYGLD